MNRKHYDDPVDDIQNDVHSDDDIIAKVNKMQLQQDTKGGMPHGNPKMNGAMGSQSFEVKNSIDSVATNPEAEGAHHTKDGKNPNDPNNFADQAIQRYEDMMDWYDDGEYGDDCM